MEPNKIDQMILVVSLCVNAFGAKYATSHLRNGESLIKFSEPLVTMTPETFWELIQVARDGSAISTNYITDVKHEDNSLTVTFKGVVPHDIPKVVHTSITNGVCDGQLTSELVTSITYSNGTVFQGYEGSWDELHLPNPLKNVLVDGLERKVEGLERHIDMLEEYRPHWAKGYTDDGQAAQSYLNVTLAMWKLLGVNDHTAGMAKLNKLLGNEE